MRFHDGDWYEGWKIWGRKRRESSVWCQNRITLAMCVTLGIALGWIGRDAYKLWGRKRRESLVWCVKTELRQLKKER